MAYINDGSDGDALGIEWDGDGTAKEAKRTRCWEIEQEIELEQAPLLRELFCLVLIWTDKYI